MSTHTAEPENVFVTLGTIDGELNQDIEYRQFSSQRPDWNLCDDSIDEYQNWAE